MAKKLIFALLLKLLVVITAFSQESSTKVEMADAFRADGKIFVVIAVAGIILTGIIVFLIMLERKINKLESKN
jgi:hypothetical protein